jgi:hypothetical protein
MGAFTSQGLEVMGSTPVIPPQTQSAAGTDERYLELLTRALRVCASYKPRFGRGRAAGLTLDQFRQMYGSDPFYQWVGLDSPLMYAAHKAAGGMTSIYRQLGIGSQWIFSAVLQDTLGLSVEQASWTYQVPTANGGVRTLSLDGRIELDDVAHENAHDRLEVWFATVKSKLLLPPEPPPEYKGVVFEVRQGYKSKDSKRQNADISNASSAYAYGYVPTLLLFSTQIDSDVAARYMQAHWLLLSGTVVGTTTDSTYVFCRDVLGYDLAGFYERNSGQIKQELENILSMLLEA